MMPWYNENTYYQRGHSEGYTAKPAKYVERGRFNALEEKVDRNEIAIGRNEVAIEGIKRGMGDAFEQIRYNYAEIHDLNQRLEKIEMAPSVIKKKRRVTVCAGGEKVEVIKL